MRHRRGQLKRTWEVLRDEGVHSYRIGDNETYKVSSSDPDASACRVCSFRTLTVRGDPPPRFVVTASGSPLGGLGCCLSPHLQSALDTHKVLLRALKNSGRARSRSVVGAWRGRAARQHGLLQTMGGKHA